MNYFLPPAVALSGFDPLHEGRNRPGLAVTASLRRRWPSIRVAALAPDDSLPDPDALVVSFPAKTRTGAGRPDAVFAVPGAPHRIAPFLRHLDAARAHFPFEVLVPVLDTEVDFLNFLRDDLEARGILLMLPSREAYLRRRMESLPVLCAEAGVKIPRTHIVSGYDEIDRAYVWSEKVADEAPSGLAWRVKTPFSPSVRVARAGDVRGVVERCFSEWCGAVRLQEEVEGEPVSVLVVGNGKGGALATGTIRKPFRLDSGRFLPGVTLNDARLNLAVAALLRVLRWDGPAEFEFIRTLSGEPYLLAIHPCFPDWADVPAALDCNLAALALHHLVRSSRLARNGGEGMEPASAAGAVVEMPAGRFLPLESVPPAPDSVPVPTPPSARNRSAQPCFS